MENFTVQDLVIYIKKELQPIYPDTEVEAITAHVLHHLLNFNRSDIYLKSATNVSKTLYSQLEKIVKELKTYKPLQYVLGHTSFYGCEFEVNEHVLIPRPETEELVDWVLQENNQDSCTMIDFGTGSGCIAVSLAKNRPNWQVYGVDISEEALLTAKQNASVNKTNVFFKQDNLLELSDDMMNRRFDLIVSNPPYVTMDQKEEMHANVVDFEPHVALFTPIDDPLIFYKRIASFAQTNLIPGGSVYVEINEARPEETLEVFAQLGFEVQLKLDIHGKYRMLKASKFVL